jgi:hypothetical protein
MKTRNLLRKIGGMLVAFAFIFSACEEIETSSLTLDQTETATIEVYVYAELDKTNFGIEYAPNDTKVKISIANSQFNPMAQGFWTTTALVSNGIVEVEVPTNAAGVNVTIEPEDFIYNQVQPYGSGSTTIAYRYYYNTLTTVNVKAEEHKILEVTYSNTKMSDQTEFVSRRFQLEADLDATEAGDEVVPSGTVVTFYNNDWTATATVGSDGIVQIDVPRSSIIDARFEYSKKLEADPVVRKNYRYSTNLGSFTESSPTPQYVNFWSGELWE